MAFRRFRRALMACAAMLGARTPLAAQQDMSHMSHMMMAADPLGVSMDRFGSGTTWLPDAVSLPALRGMTGPWSLMAHGFAFAEGDAQAGPRGAAQLGSLNWGMFMASRDLAGGRFQARTMLSLDRAGVGPRGYPLLLQSGETVGGEPLHDRQHPHDFWMELGAMYERPVSQSVGLFGYVAPSGEPALGPVAFMHRPSAMDNPFAPITHHWQDATHIAFGVVTAGVFGHRWKIEGSSFNGREPDENRWDFDPIRLNSYSGRLTVNPTDNWSLTAGYGFIKSPESDHPTESLHRIVASAMYDRRVGAAGQWTTTAVWGANAMPGTALSASALLESEWVVDSARSLFGRAEWVKKSSEDLSISPSDSGPFGVGEVTLGFVREVRRWRASTFGVGAAGTINVVPTNLRTDYGSRTPVGGMVFLRWRPTSQSASDHMR